MRYGRTGEGNSQKAIFCQGLMRNVIVIRAIWKTYRRLLTGHKKKLCSSSVFLICKIEVVQLWSSQKGLESRGGNLRGGWRVMVLLQCYRMHMWCLREISDSFHLKQAELSCQHEGAVVFLDPGKGWAEKRQDTQIWTSVDVWGEVMADKGGTEIKQKKEGVALWRSRLKKQKWLIVGKDMKNWGRMREANVDILDEEGFSTELSSGSSGNWDWKAKSDLWKGFIHYVSDFHGFLIWEWLWLFSFPLFHLHQAKNRILHYNKSWNFHKEV